MKGRIVYALAGAVFLCICAIVLFAFISDRPDTSSTPDSGGASYQKITAVKAKEMMDSGEPYILLDVRTESEYAQMRIDGALLIPAAEIRVRAADELPDKSALILVYCRSGGRSAAATRELVGMGYTNVYDFGGILSWPYDTVSG